MIWVSRMSSVSKLLMTALVWTSLPALAQSDLPSSTRPIFAPEFAAPDADLLSLHRARAQSQDPASLARHNELTLRSIETWFPSQADPRTAAALSFSEAKMTLETVLAHPIAGSFPAPAGGQPGAAEAALAAHLELTALGLDSRSALKLWFASGASVPEASEAEWTVALAVRGYDFAPSFAGQPSELRRRWWALDAQAGVVLPLDEWFLRQRARVGIGASASLFVTDADRFAPTPSPYAPAAAIDGAATLAPAGPIERVLWASNWPGPSLVRLVGKLGLAQSAQRKGLACPAAVARPSPLPTGLTGPMGPIGPIGM